MGILSVFCKWGIQMGIFNGDLISVLNGDYEWDFNRGF